MSTTYDKAAFEQICAEAKPAKSFYVSLYVEDPYYGGPEEGGWWGSDTNLVAYHECVSDEAAEAIRKQVEALAEKLSKDAKDAFGRHCADSMEWLEARGLDADYLPEPDGESRYWVAVESRPGEHNSQGGRHYE